MPKQISSQASSVSEDSCRADAQAEVARTLIADIMVAQTDDKETALWTDVDLDLNLAELHSADVNQVVAQVFTQLTASSPLDSDGPSARALARSPEDGLHSEIAQELAYQILAKQAPSLPSSQQVSEPRAPGSATQPPVVASPPSLATRWQSEVVEAAEASCPVLAVPEVPKTELSSVQLTVSDNTDSLVAQSIARRALGPESNAGSQIPPLGEPDLERSSDDGGATELIARDIISSASPLQQPPRLYSGSHSQLSDGNTNSIAAGCVARQAVAPLLQEFRCGPGSVAELEKRQSVEEVGMATFFEDAISAAIARDIMLTPHFESLHGGETSDPEPCDNTDSMIANSIVRQVVLPHMVSAQPQPNRTSGAEDEVKGQAPTEPGFSVQAMARDLVTSASMQQSDERGTQPSPSQHEVSENTDSMVANSITRQVVLPHLADSESGTPVQGSHAAGVEEVAGQAPAESGFSVQAMARDLVTSASMQQSDERGTQLSPSQHEVSENTDSMVANSITRQVVLPHLADSESGTPVQGSHAAGVEEVAGQAPAESGFSVQAMARDLVTSASMQQSDERGTQPSPSQHEVSENTDSMVANSITHQVVLPHLADSESGTPVQESHAAGVEEVAGQAPAESGFSVQAMARDLVTSASMQQSDERGTQPSPSQHEVSENTDSMVANSITHQVVLPHLADSESGTPVQESHAAGVEEVAGQAPAESGFSVQAMARDLVTSASMQQSDERGTQPSPSQHEVSENTDSMIANSITRQVVLPHLADSESGTPAQESHAAGVEEVPGQAVSEGGIAAQAMARDLVTSASMQQSDERGTQLSPSQHEVSENTDSMVANSITRQVFLPHLADSESGTPAQGSHAAGVEEVTGQAVSEGGMAAQAMARDLVTSASMQQSDERGTQPSPSQHEVPENTDLMVANSITRQVVLPHLADSESGTPAQGSHAAGVEEVTGQAVSEGGIAAQAMARDLVTSASMQQSDERGTQPSPSQHEVPENTDSMVVNSITRQVFLPHLADSESGTPAQGSHAAGVEEVTGQAVSEGGIAAQAMARDLVTSASMQQSDERGTRPSPSQHEVPENTDSMVVNSITRQVFLPHLADSESGTPAQGSHAAGVEEVTGQAVSEGGIAAQAMARDLVTSASMQREDQSLMYPVAAQECAEPEFRVAQVVARNGTERLRQGVEGLRGSESPHLEVLLAAEDVSEVRSMDQNRPVVSLAVADLESSAASPRSQLPALLAGAEQEEVQAAGQALELTRHAQDGFDASPASAGPLSDVSADARHLAAEVVAASHESRQS